MGCEVCTCGLQHVVVRGQNDEKGKLVQSTRDLSACLSSKVHEKKGAHALLTESWMRGRMTEELKGKAISAKIKLPLDCLLFIGLKMIGCFRVTISDEL